MIKLLVINIRERINIYYCANNFDVNEKTTHIGICILQLYIYMDIEIWFDI